MTGLIVSQASHVVPGEAVVLRLVVGSAAPGSPACAEAVLFAFDLLEKRSQLIQTHRTKCNLHYDRPQLASNDNLRLKHHGSASSRPV